MTVREFEGATLKECLNRVRADLGPEAVILQSQKVKRGGLMGWRAQDVVRIVAAE